MVLICVALAAWCSRVVCARLQLLSVSCFMCEGTWFLGVFVSGTIHRPVLVQLLSVSTILPLYLTSTPIPHFVNETSYPALHNFTTDINECDASPGMMWQNRAARGNIGMSRSPVCKDCTWSPSGSVTQIGSVAICLLQTGVPVTKK
jgi:hypothetical protein